MIVEKTRQLFTEPLLHFFLVGVALFLIDAWRGDRPAMPAGRTVAPPTQITVTRDDIDRLTALFAKTWQRPSSAAEQQALIEEFIRNEVFYREALAIGLERDDEVLKRRLRQKIELIYEDISALAKPTDHDLSVFMPTHRENYLAGPQVAFQQVHVSQ